MALSRPARTQPVMVMETRPMTLYPRYQHRRWCRIGPPKAVCVPGWPGHRSSPPRNHFVAGSMVPGMHYCPVAAFDGDPTVARSRALRCHSRSLIAWRHYCCANPNFVGSLAPQQALSQTHHHEKCYSHLYRYYLTLRWILPLWHEHETKYPAMSRTSCDAQVIRIPTCVSFSIPCSLTRWPNEMDSWMHSWT
jgi:hypothetical protein